MAFVPAVIAGSFFRMRRRFVVPLGLAALVAVPLVALSVGFLVVSPAERGSLLYDGLLLAVVWLAALALASLTSASPENAARVDEALAWAAVGALLIVSPIGLCEAWLGWQWLPAVRPPAGPYLNRNVAAQALVLLVPLALAAAAQARRRAGRRIALTATGLGVAFLIATRSRGGWAAAAVGWGFALLVLAWTYRRDIASLSARLARPAAWLLLVTGIAVFLPVRGVEPLPGVGRAMALIFTGGESTQIRQALWRNGAAMIAGAPLRGVGAGRFSVIYPLYNAHVVPTPDFGLERQPEHAHADLIEYAAEIGAPAAFALAALLFIAIVRSLRVARRDLSQRSWALARLAGLVAVGAHGLVSFPLHSPASALLAFLLAGRAWENARPLLCREGAWAARGAVLCGVAAAVLCVVAVVMVGPELKAQRALGQALASYEQSQRTDEPRLASRLRAAAAAGAEEAAAFARHRRTSSIAAVLLYANEKGPARSLALLEPALAANPHQLNLLLDTGARRLKAGQALAAEGAFRHALEISPGLGRAWLGLAMSCDALGDNSGAAVACARAIMLAEGPEAQLFCESRGYQRGYFGPAERETKRAD